MLRKKQFPISSGSSSLMTVNFGYPSAAVFTRNNYFFVHSLRTTTTVAHHTTIFNSFKFIGSVIFFIKLLLLRYLKIFATDVSEMYPLSRSTLWIPFSNLTRSSYNLNSLNLNKMSQLIFIGKLIPVLSI